MIPTLHAQTSSYFSVFLVNFPKSWHERLSQPSVSPATSTSTGDPRWPSTLHTGGISSTMLATVFRGLDQHSLCWQSFGCAFQGMPLLTPSCVTRVERHHSGPGLSPLSPLARLWPSLWDVHLRDPGWPLMSCLLNFPSGKAAAEPPG